jgi:hypothetical protein
MGCDGWEGEKASKQAAGSREKTNTLRTELAELHAYVAIKVRNSLDNSMLVVMSKFYKVFLSATVVLHA